MFVCFGLAFSMCESFWCRLCVFLPFSFPLDCFAGHKLANFWVSTHCLKTFFGTVNSRSVEARTILTKCNAHWVEAVSMACHFEYHCNVAWSGICRKSFARSQSIGGWGGSTGNSLNSGSPPSSVPFCFGILSLLPCEIYWVQVSPSESKWIQVSPSESKWVQVNPSETKWIQVNPS